MNPGRIHPGSLIFLGYLFLLLAACSGKKINSLKPEGYENQKLLTIEKGNLKGFFVDNTAINPAHKEGYNGLGQLYHAEEDSGIFVPAFAGFNFEHIFGGDSLEQLFEPRRYPMTLYRKTGDEVLLYQEETPLSGVESLTSFKLVAPHYIDVTFQCILHKSEFFRHGYAGLFWASYIRNPDDKKIYFKGVSENDPVGSTSWIPAWSPEHGVKSTHRSVKDDHDFFFSENFNASLANHFSAFRFTEPYFFGRYKNMVLAFLFKSGEVIRFSQSPDGGGDLNPAWDFQYIIPSPVVGRRYSFKVRMVYKPFISPEDIAVEFKKWNHKK